MGSWGVGPFENDDAEDFLGDLESSRDDAVAHLRETLLAASTQDEYLEAPEGAIAVAAAAIVALVIRDGLRDVAPEDAQRARQLLIKDDLPELQPAALAALDRVAAEDSELRELWEDAEEGEAWRGTLDAIRSPLKA